MTNRWELVVAELEDQLRFDRLLEFEIERRNRTTMQCQRLLPDLYVARATPVTAIRRPNTKDPKGPHVVAFTSDGPYLFRASSSNPGLPRNVIGAIPDPSPISLAPHEREGGTLRIGDRTYIVPYLYAAGIRELIVELSSLDDTRPDGGA